MFVDGSVSEERLTEEERFASGASGGKKSKRQKKQQRKAQSKVAPTYEHVGYAARTDTDHTQQEDKGSRGGVTVASNNPSTADDDCVHDGSTCNDSPSSSPRPPSPCTVEQLTCSTCQSEFASRNKLFAHLKASGHARLIEQPPGPNSKMRLPTKAQRRVNKAKR